MTIGAFNTPEATISLKRMPARWRSPNPIQQIRAGRPWKAIFAAAEKTGGVEFYLIEQEGSDYSEFETAQKCLANYRAMRA